MESSDIRHYSLEELKAMRRENKNRTHMDAPAQPVDEDFWRRAHFTMPDTHLKIHTGIRLDADMLAWFKEQGRGWQTRMNAVLRSYYEAHTDRSS